MADVAVVSRLRFDPTIERVEYRTAGQRLSDLVAEAIPGATGEQLDRVVVTITSPKGSWVVPRSRWHQIKTIEGRTVDIRARVAGGNILKTILSVVILIAATLLLGPGGPLAASLGLSAAGSALAIAGVTTAGQLLLNALIPNTAGSQDKPEDRYSLTGARNGYSPWGAVPKLVGRHRVTPPYAALPYTEVSDDDVYLHCAFIISEGPVQISDLRIGDTPLSKYHDIDIDIREGWPGDSRLTLYEECVFEDSLNIELVHDDGQTVRRTVTRTDGISLVLLFPLGLGSYNDAGDVRNYSVEVEVKYRKIGENGDPDGDWVYRPNIFIEEAKREPFRREIRWEADGPGLYDVSVWRWTGDTDDSQVSDTIVWSTMRSIRHEYPINYPRPLALVALRIRASKQLNGVIDTFNCIVDSILPDWDAGTGTWTPRETRNPASIFRHMLIGNSTALPRTASQVDDAVLAEWHEWCDAKGFTYDRYCDFDASLRDSLAQCAAAGRASPTQASGKWSVIIDRPQSILRGHVTPRNAVGFSGEMSYRKLPDALRVKYLNELDDWKPAERIVLRPGLVGPPVLYEEIEFPGVTHPTQAKRAALWRFGELMLRAETFFATQDFESLFSPRGSLVALQYPVLSAAQVACRVKEVIVLSGVSTRVVLDDVVTMDAGHQYACRFRHSDNTSSLWTVETRAGETSVITLDAGDGLPEPGDLAMFGLRDYETKECIVKAVEAQKDLAARLTLVPHAPEIEGIADDGDDLPVPPDPTLPPWAGRNPEVPVIVSVISGETGAALAAGAVVVRVRTGGGTVPVDHFVVTAQRGAEAPISITVPASSGRAQFNDFAVGDTISVTAVAVSAYSHSSAASAPVSHTIVARADLPANPDSLAVFVLADGTRHFTWTVDPAATADQKARIAGFVLAARPGSGLSWNDLTLINEPIHPDSPLDTPQPVTAGPHTVGVASIDQSGRICAKPKVIDVVLAASSASRRGRLDASNRTNSGLIAAI